MQTMLQREYLSVLEAKTEEALLAELVRFADQMGFLTISAMAVADRAGSEPDFITIDNAPAGFRAIAEHREVGKHDPVMQYLKHKSVPILWDQDTYVRAGRGDKWEMQAPFGLGTGIAVAMHLPHGRHFVMGMDRRQALPDDPAEVTRMAASLQLFAGYAHEAAMPLLMPADTCGGRPSLTARELEVLRWTLEGKTAWEVGRILGISENTVTRHAHHATQKLGCTSKHHAAVKALRFGLIR